MEDIQITTEEGRATYFARGTIPRPATVASGSAAVGAPIDPHAVLTQERQRAAGRLSPEEDLALVARIYGGQGQATFADLREERAPREAAPEEPAGTEQYAIERYSATAVPIAGVTWDEGAVLEAGTAAKAAGMSRGSFTAGAVRWPRGVATVVPEGQIAEELERVGADLRARWGAQYQAKLAAITAVVEELGIAEDVDQSGLGRRRDFLLRMDALIEARAQRERIERYKRAERARA